MLHNNDLQNDPEYIAFLERIGKHQHIDMMQRTIYHVLFSKYIPPRHGEPYMPTLLTRNQVIHPPPTVSLWRVVHALHGKWITSLDSVGWSPLHYLCMQDNLDDHLDLFEAFLQLLTEADINNRDVVTAPAPIMLLISRHNNYKAVQLMMQYGADINIRTRNKRSVFHYLIHLNQGIPLNTFDLVYPLIAHQSLVVCVENKTTPLHTLCGNHNIDHYLELFEAILTCYSPDDMNTLDDNGVPPVFYLVRFRNNHRALQLMMKYGANVGYCNAHSIGNILTYGHHSVYYIDKPTLELLFTTINPRISVRQRNSASEFFLLRMLSDPPNEDVKIEQSEIMDMILPFYTQEELALGVASRHPYELPSFIPSLSRSDSDIETGHHVCSVVLAPYAQAANTGTLLTPGKQPRAKDYEPPWWNELPPSSAPTSPIPHIGGVTISGSATGTAGGAATTVGNTTGNTANISQPKYIRPLVTPFSLLFKHGKDSINLIVAFQLSSYGAFIRTVSPFDHRNILHLLFHQSFSPPDVKTLQLLYNSLLPDAHYELFHRRDILGMTAMMYFVSGPYIMNQIPALEWLLSLVCSPDDLLVVNNEGKNCLDLVPAHLYQVVKLLTEYSQFRPAPYHVKFDDDGDGDNNNNENDCDDD